MKRSPLVCMLSLTLVGCGGGGQNSITTTPTPPANVAGSWHGTAASHVFSGAAYLDMFITQSGTTVQSPEVLVTGVPNNPANGGLTPCGGDWALTGTVDANNVNLTLNVPQSNPTNSAVTTISSVVGGNTISGTYTTTTYCQSDSGTFTIQLIPSLTSSQWTGQINDNNGGSATFTANIAEDSSGNLTGGLTFPAGSGCTQILVTGSIIGNQVSLAAVAGQGQSFQTLSAEVDTTGKSIIGTYVASCIGPNDNGSFVVSTP